MTDATTLPAPPRAPQVDDSPSSSDEDAPYGRKADGTPYKRPPRAYDLNRRAHKGGGGSKRKRPGSGSKTRPVSPPPPGGGTRSAEDYAQIAAETVIGWPLGIELAWGMQSGNRLMLADAWALDTHGPKVAEQLGALAVRSPRLAAVLEWANRLNGPAGIATALMPLWMQLGANREKIRPGVMSTIDRDTAAMAIVSKAQEEAMRAAQEAMEAVRHAMPDMTAPEPHPNGSETWHQASNGETMPGETHVTIE